MQLPSAFHLCLATSVLAIVTAGCAAPARDHLDSEGQHQALVAQFQVACQTLGGKESQPHTLGALDACERAGVVVSFQLHRDQVYLQATRPLAEYPTVALQLMAACPKSHGALAAAPKSNTDGVEICNGDGWSAGVSTPVVDTERRATLVFSATNRASGDGANPGSVSLPAFTQALSLILR